jgi:hypothetical protein
MTVDDVVKQCRNSGLNGWELVEFAQKLVSGNMKYAYNNSFNMPKKAFKKGKGYCWHQSGVLNSILRKLDFKSRLVFSVKNLVPEKMVEGVLIKEHYSGHVWCRVNFDGVEKDVCPGSIKNKPGVIHFKPISKVKEWNAWIGFWSYWGSFVVNYKRFKEFKRLKEKQDLRNNPKASSLNSEG